MKTHTISVTVGRDAIQVVPETLVMTLADEVTWAGANTRRFSVVFDGAGPLAARELAHAAATSKQRPVLRGHFKYSVVSEENPALTLDPVIVVEEPPTEGKP